MSIIGFNFTKIDVEKKKPVSDKINISNNVSIVDVVENDFNISADQKSIRFKFEFSSKYEPDMGHIGLHGEIITLEPKAKAKDIIDNWKKNKKIDKELMIQLLNNVLVKCNIQALILSQTVNLPPPVRLPSVSEAPEQKPAQKSKI